MLPAHPHPPIHSRKNNFELNTKSFSRPLLFFLDRNALFYESRKKYVKAFIHPKIVSTSRADKHLQKIKNKLTICSPAYDKRIEQ